MASIYASSPTTRLNKPMTGTITAAAMLKVLWVVGFL
jgi:hypothetical protein